MTAVNSVKPELSHGRPASVTPPPGLRSPTRAAAARHRHAGGVRVTDGPAVTVTVTVTVTVLDGDSGTGRLPGWHRRPPAG
jgi:hypothetical protein